MVLHFPSVVQMTGNSPLYFIQELLCNSTTVTSVCLKKTVLLCSVLSLSIELLTAFNEMLLSLCSLQQQVQHLDLALLSSRIQFTHYYTAFSVADGSEFGESLFPEHLVFSSVAEPVQCVDISIDDEFVEDTEFFSVGLVPLNANDTIIHEMGNITVTVLDDDGRHVEILKYGFVWIIYFNVGVDLQFNESVFITVSESDGLAPVYVKLASVKEGLQRDVVINVTVQSATAGIAIHLHSLINMPPVIRLAKLITQYFCPFRR